jgi:hypothetical protein
MQRAACDLAFLSTFIGVVIAGVAWAALFLGLLESDDASLRRLGGWFSPDSAPGWIFFVALSAALTWLIYRFLSTRLPRP